MQPAYIGCGYEDFLLFLAERTQWVVNPPHYGKISIEGIMSGKKIYQYSKVLTVANGYLAQHYDY